MRKEDIKHMEVILKSYKVMLKTLEIRLDLIEENMPQGSYMKKTLAEKIDLYKGRVAALEHKLKENEGLNPVNDLP